MASHLTALNIAMVILVMVMIVVLAAETTGAWAKGILNDLVVHKASGIIIGWLGDLQKVIGIVDVNFIALITTTLNDRCSINLRLLLNKAYLLVQLLRKDIAWLVTHSTVLHHASAERYRIAIWSDLKPIYVISRRSWFNWLAGYLHLRSPTEVISKVFFIEELALVIA